MSREAVLALPRTACRGPLTLPIPGYTVAAMGLRVCALRGTALVASALVCAAPASAARLATPKEAKPLRAAFLREKGHKGATVTAITVSTAAPGWAALAYVPVRKARSASLAKAKIITVKHKIYRDKPVSHPKPARRPPKKAKVDLSKDFFVDIAYEGQGEEHFAAHEVDTAGCGTPGETTTGDLKVDVTPMKWKQVYRVDLDKMHVLAPAATPEGDFYVLPLSFIISPPTDSSVVEDRSADSTDCTGSAGPHEQCQLTYGGATGPANVVFTSGGTLLGPLFELASNGCAGASGFLTSTPMSWVGNASRLGLPWHFVNGILSNLNARNVNYARSAVSHASACEQQAWASCSDSFDFSGIVSLHCCPGPPPKQKEVIRRTLPFAALK